MATKIKIGRYVTCMFWICLVYSCWNGKNEYTDTEMITMAESYSKQFQDYGLCSVQQRSDYYICTLEDGSSYIIGCDGNRIRNLGRNNIIISERAMTDACISDSMKILSRIVVDLFSHEIGYLKVKSDTIMLKRFDGYYLTNSEPHPYSTLKMIQDKWYVNDKRDE